MPMTPLGTPPSRSDPANFAARGDALMSALPAFVTEANALQVDVNAKQVAAAASAAAALASQNAAASSAGAASTSAANAAASSGAALWVSGAVYAVGVSTWSPLTRRTYRNKVLGSGVLDPSVDAAKWAPILLDAGTGQPTGRPSILFDFANGQTVDPRITVVRGSTATRINRKGLVEAVLSGVPRINHDPATFRCLGLLVEEQRTNLRLYSEQFDNAAYSKANVTVGVNAGIAPDGATTADRLTPSAVNGAHSLSEAIGTFAIGDIVTTSTHLRRDTGERFARLQLSSAIFSTGSAYFDLDTGVVSNVGAGSAATMVAMPGGWWRCILTATATAAGAASTFCYSYQAIGASFSGDAVAGPLVWGGQDEAGAFATSYIPTTSAQVTRAADVLSLTGANFSDWYNSAEGTFFASASYAAGSSTTNGRSILTASGGTAANLMSMRYANNSSSAWAAVTTASVAQASLVFQAAAPDQPHLFGMAYKGTDVSVSCDGGAVTAAAGVTLPVVDRLYIGSGYAGTSVWLNGHIEQMAYYPRRHDDATLQALTTQ